MIEIILIWFIYAFLGWIVETTYVSVPAGHFVERGFLRGPIIPIYAFGAFIVLYILMPYGTHPLYIFILGTLATSTLEYITSFILEKLFNMSWWDYSNQKFNINGRICLKNSILFGLLSVVLVLWINPLIVSFTKSLDQNIVNTLVPILVGITLIDLGLTLSSILGLSKRIKEDIRSHIKKGEARLLRIFPDLKSNSNIHIISELRTYLKDKYRD